MVSSALQRPRCHVCEVSPQGHNRHGLCRRCLITFRCVICGDITIRQRKGKWCVRCQKMQDINHAINLRSRGVRPDEETLAWRIALYEFRAERSLPLFDPVPWF